MKVLFAYNGRVEVDEYGAFYGNELNDRLVERYQFFGDQVSFLVRTRPILKVDAGELLAFENSQVSFLTVPEINTPLLFLRRRAKVMRLIRKSVKEHDVIISRQPGFIGRIAARFAKMYHKPCLVEVVGCPYDALTNHSTLGKMIAPYARSATRKSVLNASHVLYVTEEFLQRRYPTLGKQVGISDVVLPPGDPSILQRRIDKIDNRKDTDPLVIGTAAALDVPYKGHVYVLQAMALLKSKGITVLYKVVGKGTGKAIYHLAEKLDLTQQVEIIGQLPHEMVFDFLDGLDVYIQPSVMEGLPRSVVEAMSRACPVIGARTGGIPELLLDDCIFEKRNVDQITVLLGAVDNTQLLKWANRNYVFVQKFELTASNADREKFYSLFRLGFSTEK